jgi:hypothetical protein
MHHRYLSANVQGEPKDEFESVGQSVLLAWLNALTCAVIAFCAGSEMLCETLLAGFDNRTSD